MAYVIIFENDRRYGSFTEIGVDLYPNDSAMYAPISLTISLYDTEKLTYGFTYNTRKRPLNPILQIEKGKELTKGSQEYPCRVEEARSYDGADEYFVYYIVKTEISLSPNTVYSYRACDKDADVGSEIACFITADPQRSCFRFSHVSDSQTNGQNNDKSGIGTGIKFRYTLSEIVGNNDFLIHTGDVVEWSRYEAYWDNMVHSNFDLFSKIAINAISGNHETTYRSGSNETYKHFNNKIPPQASTERGYYYSFEYGGVKFIMLNTNECNGRALSDEQYKWLLGELESNECKWTFVAMHEPMYSLGKYGINPTMNQTSVALRDQLVGVFARYGVDIVLQGHDHIVTRTYPIDENGNPRMETTVSLGGIDYSLEPCGTIYLMNGCAGGQPRNLYHPEAYACEREKYYRYAMSSKESSWAEFSVSEESLAVSVKYVDDDGVHKYCEWGIKKPNNNRKARI